MATAGLLANASMRQATWTRLSAVSSFAALDAGSANALYTAARADEQAKRYPEALAALDRTIEIAPQHASAHYLRARTHWFLKQYDAAARDYGTYIALRPDDTYGYWARAQVHNARGEFRAAIVDADAALRLDPKLSGVLYHRAYALYRIGDLKSSMHDVQRGLAIEPNDECLKGLLATLQRAIEGGECEALISQLPRPATVADLWTSLNRG